MHARDCSGYGLIHWICLLQWYGIVECQQLVKTSRPIRQSKLLCAIVSSLSEMKMSHHNVIESSFIRIQSIRKLLHSGEQTAICSRIDCTTCSQKEIFFFIFKTKRFKRANTKHPKKSIHLKFLLAPKYIIIIIIIESWVSC